MANQDWERFGEEILRNVQEAIDSRDYVHRSFNWENDAPGA